MHEIIIIEIGLNIYSGFSPSIKGSSFMFGRLFTSVFWGIVADQYGRKPVAIINIISV